MANLTPVNEFPDVYQLEVTDPVQGGPGGIANTQAQQLLNRTTYLKAITDGLVGQVASFAANTPPTGWLACNGAAISRTTYATLWTYVQASGMLAVNALDKTNNPGKFGTGNGTTTFDLPDLRGEFIRGWDNSRGIDNPSVTFDGVTHIGSPTIDTIASTAGLHAGMSVVGTNIPVGAKIVSVVLNTSITLDVNCTGDLGVVGIVASGRSIGTNQETEEVASGSGANGLPRNVALLFCIKY